MANWLYNGIELPRLPEWDKTAYPYAFIFYSNLDMTYFLITFDKRPIAYYVHNDYYDTDFLYIGSPDNCSYQWWGSSRDNWAERTEPLWVRKNSPGYGMTSSEKELWANTDILFVDGTLYLATSNPIRLDSKLSISVQSAKEGMWLYNGVSLPPLPDYDPEEYPYVTIEKITLMTELIVNLTIRKTWVQSVSEYGSYDLLRQNVGDVQYKIKKIGYFPSIESLTATDWGEPKVLTSEDEGNSRMSGFIWTNEDIVSLGSDEYKEGETILAASEAGPVVATFTCTNLNETDSAYKIAAWCYPKGTHYLDAPHTYTSSSAFAGTEHFESWALTGLTDGTEYELYACIMVDAVTTDHNAIVTFTTDGVEELDFSNATLTVSKSTVDITDFQFELDYTGLPYNADGTSAVFHIVGVTDAGDEALMGWRASSGDGSVAGVFFDLEPLTDYTATFEVYYNGQPTGVTAAVSFTTEEEPTDGGFDHDSFLLGFASGLGCTAATVDGAEYNSWAQGYIVGSALRKAL